MSDRICSHFFADTRTKPASFVGTTYTGPLDAPVTLAVGREATQPEIEAWIAATLAVQKIHPKLSAPDSGKREALAAGD